MPANVPMNTRPSVTVIRNSSRKRLWIASRDDVFVAVGCVGDDVDDGGEAVGDGGGGEDEAIGQSRD